MRSIGSRKICWLALVALCGGCSWHEWFSRPEHGATPAGAPPGSAAPAAPPRPGWQPPEPTPVPPAVPSALTAGYSEQLSLMGQRLAASEDDKRALTSRVKLLEQSVKDKDRALAQAALEIQEASAQIKSTREELHKWKQEMESLRGKLRNVERDNKVTLEAIIHTLEQFLDRDKRGVDVPGPDLGKP
jgi:hypothetical protein